MYLKKKKQLWENLSHNFWDHPQKLFTWISPKNKNNNWDSTGLTGKSESRFMSALNIVCICLAELFPTPLKQWSYEKMKNWICQSGSD